MFVINDNQCNHATINNEVIENPCLLHIRITTTIIWLNNSIQWFVLWKNRLHYLHNSRGVRKT